MNFQRKKLVLVPPFMRRITPYNDMYSNYTTRFVNNNPYQRSARRRVGGTPIRNQPSTGRPVNPAEPVELSKERFMCAERGTQTDAEDWQTDECCSTPETVNCVSAYSSRKNDKYILQILLGGDILKISNNPYRLEKLKRVVNDCNEITQKQLLEEYESLKSDTSLMLTKFSELHNIFADYNSKYSNQKAIVNDLQ